MEWRSVHPGIGMQNRKTRVFYGCFPLSPKCRKFRSEVKWKGPFRFGQTGIFGTTSGGGPLWPVGSVGPKFTVPFTEFVVPSSALPSLAWYIHDGDSADLSVQRLLLYNDWPNRIINAFLLCVDDYPRYVSKVCWQFLLFRGINSLNIAYIHFPAFCFRNVTDRFDRKMSFHYSVVGPAVSDRSESYNGKHPCILPENRTHIGCTWTGDP